MTSRRGPAFLVLAFAGWVGPTSASAQANGGQCAGCHRALADPSLSGPAIAWQADVHLQAGLTCTGCHGGDAVATDPGVAHTSMLARPPRERIPELCGRCHANQEFMRGYDPDIRIDQVETYFTSVHGQRLLEGDPRVAVCVDCHTTHSIQPSSETTSSIYPPKIPELCGSCHADRERMAPYGIPTDQLEEYKTSIHWATMNDRGDLSAPVCNDCHGNHGAVPPGFEAVGRVCGSCHFQVGQYFASSPHDSVFVGLERPGCATCHGNHAIQVANDELLGLGDRSTCVDAGCHTDADAGGRVARQALVLVDSLIGARARSDSILGEAERAGMPVEQAQFELAKAQNAIVSARAVLHTASIDSLRAKIDEGLEVASAGFEAGEDAFTELHTRRTGLAVSAAVILLVIGGLLIKIRDLGAP